MRECGRKGQDRIDSGPNSADDLVLRTSNLDLGPTDLVLGPKKLDLNSILDLRIWILALGTCWTELDLGPIDLDLGPTHLDLRSESFGPWSN